MQRRGERLHGVAGRGLLQPKVPHRAQHGHIVGVDPQRLFEQFARTLEIAAPLQSKCAQVERQRLDLIQRNGHFREIDGALDVIGRELGVDVFVNR